MVLDTFGCVNVNGMNAPLTTGVDRHVIVSAAGGMDPNSNFTVPMVYPGGGNYSLRLGDDYANGAVFGSQYARSEAIRLTFTVTPQNAGFSFHYAVFLEQPLASPHPTGTGPRFETFIYDSVDNVIPCGYYIVTTDTCSNQFSSFQLGACGANVSQWWFQPWTTVGLDLTGYIGHPVSIEFRTSDCFPPALTTSSVAYNTINGVTTTTYSSSYTNGTSCSYDCTTPAVGCVTCTPQNCNGLLPCNSNAPGNHDAYVYIDAECRAMAINTPVVCLGTSSIQVCAPNGYLSYSWPSLSGSPTTQCVTLTNPHPGDTATVYMISMIGGCPTSTTIRLQGPDLTLTDTVFCAGTTGSVTASATPTVPGNYSYAWTGPNSFSSTAQNPSIPIPSSTSTYTVVATDTSGCQVAKTMTINILPPIALQISPDVSICPGASSVLTAGGGIQYTWSPAASLSTTTGSTTTATPSQTTIYYVIATDTSGCTATDSVTITISPNLILNVSPDTSICSGDNTQLTSSGGGTYLWTPSTGLSANNIANPVASPTVTTTYSVNVISAGGCTGSASVTVSVNPLPVITVSPAATVCNGSSTQLSASGGVTYSWSPANGLTTPNLPTTTATPTQTTTYIVDVIDANGCTGSNSVTVNVEQPPVANAGPDADICEGQSVQLNASGGTNYIWSPPTWLNNVSISNPVSQPIASITYTVTTTNGNAICPPASDAMTIIVHPIPTVDAGKDTTVMAGTEVQLHATGTGSSYQWNPPTGLSCIFCLDPVVSPLNTTSYIVITTDPFGCRSQDTVVINVEDILTLYVPNSFTPSNDDLKNDVFYAYGVGIYTFEFYIFDRWGNKVFETHDPYTGWNGSFKGILVQEDVYVWLAKANSITGKTISRTGTVTVVR